MGLHIAPQSFSPSSGGALPLPAWGDFRLMTRHMPELAVSVLWGGEGSAVKGNPDVGAVNGSFQRPTWIWVANTTPGKSRIFSSKKKWLLPGSLWPGTAAGSSSHLRHVVTDPGLPPAHSPAGSSVDMSLRSSFCFRRGQQQSRARWYLPANRHG